MIRFLQFSFRCSLIDVNSDRELISGWVKGGEFLNFSRLSQMPHQLKFLKKFLRFLAKTDLPCALRYCLLLFKCIFVLTLPWLTRGRPTRGISFCLQMLNSNLLTASTFFIFLSPRGTIFEITTVLFSVFKDVAIIIICSVILYVHRLELDHLDQHLVYKSLYQISFCWYNIIFHITGFSGWKRSYFQDVFSIQWTS